VAEDEITIITILTASEAATVLRCSDTDANLLMLLSQIDSYLKNATGRDWTLDDPILPEAKAAARMLLVMWYENPGMIGSVTSMNFGLTAALVQLESIALELVE
jgi:hypothetical protein